MFHTGTRGRRGRSRPFAWGCRYACIQTGSIAQYVSKDPLVVFSYIALLLTFTAPTGAYTVMAGLPNKDLHYMSATYRAADLKPDHATQHAPIVTLWIFTSTHILSISHCNTFVSGYSFTSGPKCPIFL